MDRLDEIFRMQQALNDDIIAKRHLEGISNTEWIQKQTLAMLSEMAELLDEVNFKWWKNPKPVDDHAVKEELVDILHFFVGGGTFFCRTYQLNILRRVIIVFFILYRRFIICI